MVYINGLIAAFIACMLATRAYIAAQQLRLDLYKKRFDIYSIALDFYQEVQKGLDYSRISGERFISLKNQFEKALREARFIFGSESGVYFILNYMLLNVSKRAEFIKNKDDILNSSTEESKQALISDYQELSDKFTSSMDSLNRAIAEHLNVSFFIDKLPLLDKLLPAIIQRS